MIHDMKKKRNMYSYSSLCSHVHGNKSSLAVWLESQKKKELLFKEYRGHYSTQQQTKNKIFFFLVIQISKRASFTVRIWAWPSIESSK